MGSMFDDDYFIAPLSKYSFTFPDPHLASDEGLLAYGGGLEPNRILSAYKKGIFPWFNENDPILWWSPNPRLLLYPGEFKISKSFKRFLKNKNLKVTFDNDFEQVINNCSKLRKGDKGTWLTSAMKEAYTELHHMGFAHSVEAYEDGELIGGLYGLQIGSGFFGESMFSLQSNGSKVALKALCDISLERGYEFIDCQVPTPHLQSLGARLIERDIFLDELQKSMQSGGDIGSWKGTTWESTDIEF